ncbi:cyclin-dependent protein kinase inhibitor [Moniliophthora roreri MCA 2997]|uniref:Cyclin-dependent protein kinase inhibitor n=1 Tax=Moniliophthora roreri (strain MCA 2997) TaxID=1381753 RepID=V2YPV3_MONRO|nr:cyclin-dependent protein kinase inhibitor [Moniliophthora roreri MCA 2997]
MKFGKHIQSHQVPGWSPYYLDYKSLKKIISSLEAHRPAAEAAALALGLRPGDILNQESSTSAPPSTLSSSQPSTPDDVPPPLFPASERDEDRGPEFQAHKAAFFFKLERELEKINTFYLQKEAELKLRLETLLSKRRAAAMRGLPDNIEGTTETHVEWSAVEEGFRLLERDLGKLQQFVEINATGFRKILKKFDKRSKSTTKELYLARQVDVQPVFNRQLISELSDTVASCLLNLTDLSSGLKFEGPAANDVITNQILAERIAYAGPFHDLEKNLRKAVAAGDRSAVTEFVEYSEMLSNEAEAQRNVARILWSIIVEAPPDLTDLIMASLSSPFDFHFVDDINGRTCLHEAAIAGALRLVKLCMENGVQVDRVDAYGRTALHYAAMNGHAEICKVLLETNLPHNGLDIDNYNPLVYATLRGCVECVRVILDHGDVLPHPTTPGGDVIPLSLASQAGHVDVVLLLLERGARCLANSNGEYPMHLAARQGHAHVCKVLLGQQGWDTPDKYHEWTPLFHAARYGRDECVCVLLEAGARVGIRDELGHLAVHYAAWYGHHNCVEALLEVTSRSPAGLDNGGMPESSPLSEQLMASESDIDLIPSLTLPPPIMPHRVYGHNYLDRSHLVQVNIGRSSRSKKDLNAVRLQRRIMTTAFKDESLITSAPLKLVMTTSAEVNTVPYTVSLPPKGEEGSFVFQVPSLDALTLEFSVYPNFGTKTIGRAIALPSMFSGIENNQVFTLPILDHRLHILGEVTFEVNIVTSFDGVTLEVGGGVETYWKSTAISVVPQTSLSSWTHRSSLITSAQASPLAQSIGSSGQTATVSSLRGYFLSVVVQVTRDFQPVIYSDWLLPLEGLDIGVCDVSLAQFEALARQTGRHIDQDIISSITDWADLASKAMVSLEQLLKVLPSTMGVCLEVVYPTQTVKEVLSLSRRQDLNQVVDSVLRTMYQTSVSLGGQNLARRRIVFTSFSPDVCAALNWKQPNYPVFLTAHCGKNHKGVPTRSIAFDSGDPLDVRLSSLGAAVEFARMNNLLGVFVDANLLIQVPSMIHGIRNAGLLVGIHGTSDKTAALTTTSGIEGCPVDAFLNDRAVVFVDPSTL